MNRKRALTLDTIKVKKLRTGNENELSIAKDGPLDIKPTLTYLMNLFPRKLFNDTLPPIVMKHQLYSIHDDKTQVDRQLNELRERKELLMFQLGFDSDAFGLVFAEAYKEKALAAVAGRETSGTVEKFLNTALTSCSDMSFNKARMLLELHFTDVEITQLVKSGVLTVKDAGSWWLSIPNAGKFTKYFLQGRKAVLGMIKKSRYGEVLKSDLEERRTTSQVKFHMKYHIHDVIGADLVDCIQTTSGMLLRFSDS